MKRLFFVLFFLAVVPLGEATAAYNANMRGQLEGFYIYADADYIYFRLKNQPSTHPSCDPTYFVIPDTVPADRRKMMVARLSLAYAMQEIVNIGYDSTGECAGGYIRAHRVG